MPAAKSPFRVASEAWHARRRAASVPFKWDGAAVAAGVRAEAAAAEASGLLDPGV